jgi:hypothetical protein
MSTSNRSVTKQLVVYGVVLIVVIVIIILALVISSKPKGVSFSTVRECDASAIISCGSLTAGQLESNYKASPYAQKVYAYFGISSSDIAKLTTTASAGSVSNTGSVYVKGKTAPVANNALIVSRKKVTGTHEITYQRVSFSVEALHTLTTKRSLEAYVVMHNHSFAYAVTASNDDLVIATASNAIAATLLKQTTMATPQPLTRSAKSTTGSALLNTGPSTLDSVLLFFGVAVCGSLGYHRYQKRHI